MFSSQMLQALLNERENDHPPGSASALGPTMPMRVGAALNPVLERVQDIFPKDNPYGSFIERLIVGDSPDRTRNMKEGIPHQYTGAGPNDPIIRPQILDLAGALPIGSAATLAKAAVPFVKAAAVPAAMATGAAALNRLKAPGYAATSTDDIGAALLGQSLQRQGALDNAMVAYQGSPHKFDALDPDKIGTGEGNQTFGHGMYVAENPGVAKGYQRSTPFAEMRRKFLEEIPEDAEFDELMDLVAEGHFSPQQERVLKALEADDWLGFDYPSQAISEAYSSNLKNFDPSPELVESVKGSSYLYEIDVPDEDIAKMLDWDAPLSEQPESVKRVISDSPVGKQLAPTLFAEYTGESFYKRLVELEANKVRGLPGSRLQNIADAKSPAESASKYLNELGISGIKYYDQGSRAAGKGTRNMVLFDELARRAKVLKRNDEAIAQPSVDEFIGKLLED